MPAGYSDTPLLRKVGIKAGHRVELLWAPKDWSIDVPLRRSRGKEKADVIVAFFRAQAEVTRRLPDLAGAIVADGMIWVAWPRRAGGHSSDITDNSIRAAVLPLGLVDVKVAALDEDWSGLKVVWRLENRNRQRGL
jgi:hypothetical protein